MKFSKGELCRGRDKIMKKTKAALLIAAALLLPFTALPNEPVTAASTSNSELKNLEDKLAAAVKARENAQAAVDSAKSERSDAIKSKEAIDKKITALSEEMSALEQLINGYALSIDAKNTDIDAQNEKLAKLRAVVRERARIKHEDSGADLMTILFDSNGLVDFFTGLDRYSCMLDYDERLMNSYSDALDELNSLKATLEEEKSKLEAQRAVLDVRKTEYEADKAAAEKVIADAEKDLATATANLEKVLAEEERANKEREAKLAELQKSTNQPLVSGKFLWPLPSKYTTVSCGFGWRTHPVTGKPQFHNGVDLPAPYGTEIYACNDGTVIEVSYNYADGNYVTISHGGGVASFYSHISKSTVKVGDKVKRGQVIAYVGTSGYVTGAHLNLNIYENNTAVDPMGYFK